MLHKSSLIISVRVVVCLMLLQYVQQYTVKPVLRGPFETKKKGPYKTGDLIKEVHFI
jgi:hypothetical protein